MREAFFSVLFYGNVPMADPKQTARLGERIYLPLIEKLEQLQVEGKPIRISLACTPLLLGVCKHSSVKKHNLIQRIADLAADGILELVACCATESPLPLMKTEEAIRAQIALGAQDFHYHFGFKPTSMWLPNCAFTQGIDRLLKEQGFSVFYVEPHSVLYASPRPNQSLAAPLLSPYGVTAFARNDRIDLLDRFLASGELLSEHTAKEIDLLAIRADRSPIITNYIELTKYAERIPQLLTWISALAEQHAEGKHALRLATASDYLDLYPISDTGMFSAGSSGTGGYFDDWLKPDNDWLQRHLHDAEERMINHANCFLLHKLSKLESRALNQALRELLLAQSSEIALRIADPETRSEATERFTDHFTNMKKLLEMVNLYSIDEDFLRRLEKESPFLSKADFRLIGSPDMHEKMNQSFLSKPKLGKDNRKILMLAWEFPPLVVGGLARAVYDLSKHLVKQGHDIHVVTTEVEGSPEYELMDGIHVHRMHVLGTSNTIEFLDWVFQMNTVFTDFVLRLQSFGKQFDVIHAHDWLVYYAARELKYSLDVPLIATIHATEHGRNEGKIITPVQQRIAELEWNLTFEAAHVIACSRSMEHEVKQIFQLPSDKVSMIHNGVDLPLIQADKLDLSMRERFALPNEKIIFYIGRLVYEKGIQVLIEAMPKILNSYSNCKLVIAGAGGMKEDLQRRAAYLGHKVLFVGFVDDATRNFLLKVADVCVFPSLYEPFGIVALEAMHSGTPVVVSDTGGLAEIIDHGRDGYKALPGHVDSLSWHISDLLHHPEKAKMMAEHAKYKAVNQYNWKHIAKRTAEIYEVAIKKVEFGRVIL